MIFTKQDADTVKRILIINVTRIGDTLLATPAIRAIALHYPNAEITCLGHPQRYTVYQNLPYLAKVGAISKKSAWLRGWKDALSEPEYDVAFVWGQDSALVKYALRKAKHVIAERQQNSALNARLALAFDMPLPNSIHAVARFLSMVKTCGIVAQGYQLDYAVTKTEREAAIDKLHATLDGVHFPTIGFQVASFATKAWRDWPIDRFIELGLQIVQQFPDARFVCFGAPSDKARIDQLARALRDRVANFAGDTSLRESAAIMSHLDMYVGIDTGPSHLFSTFKKPMVVLYHPIIPSALYKPLNHPALFAIDHPQAGPTCRDKVPMNDITVAPVWKAAERALVGNLSLQPGMASPGIDEGVAAWPGDALPMR